MRSIQRPWRTGLAVLLAIGITILVAIVVSGWPPNPNPPIADQTSSTPSPGPTPSPAPRPSPAPTPRVTCTAEASPLPSALSSDPCPAAIVAVELAVGPVLLPIQRIVIEPGPFYCDVIWPGVRSAPPCYGPMVRPGQFMHAWVSFGKSSKVAAVMLGLDLPDDLDAPGSTRPPWSATLVKVEIPPAGWVMP